MSKNLHLTLLALLLRGSALAQHNTDRPAVHGMLIMGTEIIYASHLPMFHSPHDYQIILILKFNNEATEAYLDDQKSHPQELVYTIEPEVFVLPEMVNRIKKFKASIYRGHFERGGVQLVKDVTVNIEKIVYFNHLEKMAVRPSLLKYILFGNEKELFLAHQISTSSDFDEITLVKTTDKDAVKSLVKPGYTILEFPEKETRQKFSWNTNSARLPDNRVVEFTQHKMLYFELGDLE